jgi:hypothetical protein
VTTDDRSSSFSDIPSEGSTMTAARKEFFLHIGGPYDGERMLVEVDGEGVPPETNTIGDITFPSHLRNPGTTSLVDSLTSLYERSEHPDRLGDDGFEYTFRYVFQDVTDLSRPMAA